VPPSAKRQTRAFLYRAGVRVRATVLACDASAGSDLIFLSSARALDARATRALPRLRAGRRQVLTTDVTLALLGAGGARLRPHALLSSFGRPFALGDLRLELFPSGYGPGAASLLCEIGSGGGASASERPRRVIYAGAIGPGPEHRPADALCLDATFGARRFAFPEPAAALAELRALVLGALGSRRAPVILVEPGQPALVVAAALIEAGVSVRAHRTVVQAAGLYARAGLAAPALQRFDGRLRAGEALLWPPEAREAPQLGRLAAPVVILASGWAADPVEVARVRADHGVALADRADFAGLLRYILATGATEVALLNPPGEELALALRGRGLDAYPLGPPSQIALFATAAAEPAHVVSGV
jgi:hypothetical protein